MRGDGHTHAELPLPSVRLSASLAVTIWQMQRTDADDVQSYFRDLSAGSRRNRFLGALSEVSAAEIERMCGVDGEPHATLLVGTQSEGLRRTIAEARYALTPDGLCEVALSVMDAWRRRGVGTLLLQLLERRARDLGARAIAADALRSNDAVKGLTRKYGFSVQPGLGDPRLMRLVKTLGPRAAAA